MREYAPYIVEMFRRGLDKLEEKLGPGQMYEEIQNRFPGKYSLPAENVIHGEISKLLD